jgi:TP901 family phage tail tape measure protein
VGEEMFRSLNSHIGTVDSSFGGLGGVAADLSKKIALVTVATGAAAATFAAFAANEAAAFETGIANINTLLSGTAENELPAIKQGILDLAGTTPSSLEELTGAFYDIQSGTGAGAEGLATLEEAIKASVAGMTDSKTAASALITVLNSYGLSADEAGRISDIMFATVQGGVLTFEDLATNVGKVASTGNAANQTFETTGAAIATLTAATGRQAESFTALEQLYNKLSTPNVRKEFEALGITVTDTHGNLLPLEDIIGKVAEKQLSYTQILQLLPEKEAAAALNILTSQYDIFEKNLNNTNNALGKTDEAFEKVAKTFDYQLGVLKSAWEKFLVIAGEPILESLGPVIEDLSSALADADASALASTLGESIGNWISALSEFLGKLNEIYGSVSDIGDASMAADFASWAGDTETIQLVLKTINTIVGGIALAVAGVHDLFVGVGNIIAGIYDVIETAILAPMYLASELVLKILEGLDKVPGMDLSGPIDSVNASAQALAEMINDNITDPAPFEYWSDDAVRRIIVVDTAINGLGNSIKELPDIYDVFNMEAITETLTGGNASLSDFQGHIQSVSEALQEGEVDVESGTALLQLLMEGAAGASDATETLQTSTKKNTQAQEESTKTLSKKVESLAKFKLGLEEIASKERVQVFEITAKLDMAEIEASTERFKRAFDSIDAGIQNTGDTIQGLFGSLAEAEDPFTKWDIEAAIDKEYKFREQEFDLQKKKIEMDMELTQAKIDYMANGEASITIDGAGLSPALEMVLWEIMELVQVRANAQGAEFLLGLPTI